MLVCAVVVLVLYLHSELEQTTAPIEVLPGGELFVTLLDKNER